MKNLLGLTQYFSIVAAVALAIFATPDVKAQTGSINAVPAPVASSAPGTMYAPTTAYSTAPVQSYAPVQEYGQVQNYAPVGGCGAVAGCGSAGGCGCAAPVPVCLCQSTTPVYFYPNPSPLKHAVRETYFQKMSGSAPYRTRGFGGYRARAGY